MIWDSRGKWDALGRGGGAVLAAFSLALSGCAFSYEDGDGRRQVVGLYDMTVDAADPRSSTDETRHFTFYGLWFDDAFRGTSIAFGEVELSIADLRNQWPGEGTDVESVVDGDDCTGRLGFRWCSLGPRDPSRAGEAFDIAVAGITIGAGARDRHFGVGYHRQILLEVTNENALVTWPSSLTLRRPGELDLAGRSFGVGGPAQVKLEGLLRGSING